MAKGKWPMAKVKGDGNISSRRLFYFIKVQQNFSGF